MDSNEPVVVKCRYNEPSLETLAVKAAADLGPLLLDGLADGIRIDAPAFDDAQLREIELMILQAARVRFSHTEYIACPSCGRTLYDIEKTLAEIKSRTSHLKNLRIGVMGCIDDRPARWPTPITATSGLHPGASRSTKGVKSSNGTSRRRRRSTGSSTSSRPTATGAKRNKSSDRNPQKHPVSEAT